MNLRADDVVSAVALVVNTDANGGSNGDSRRCRARRRRSRSELIGADAARTCACAALVRGARCALAPVIRFRYSGQTRERRWSKRLVTVLAGPWR